MSDNQDDQRQPRRLSLSKKDLAGGAASELLLLMETVTADGRITDDEAKMMRDWLEDKQLADLPSVTYLRTILQHILSDGRVTEEEKKVVYKAVEKVLPVEARRGARERRMAVDAAEKLRLREEKRQQLEEERRNSPVDGFDFMVAGCAYHNRPSAIRAYAREGKAVHLYRERENPHDSNAIMVAVDFKHHIGYVPREDAIRLADYLDRGFQFRAHVKKLITARKHDIPVVVAEIFSPDAKGEGLFTGGRGRVEFAPTLTKPSSLSDALGARPNWREAAPSASESTSTSQWAGFGCLFICGAILLVLLLILRN